MSNVLEDYIVSVKKYDRKDPRLGRNMRHDSRSLRYQVPALPVSQLESKRYESNIPTLDQGQIGSCTGNASTKLLSYEPFWDAGETVLNGDAVKDEQYAVGVYSEATALDPYDGQYPPTDTGSDGLSVAKVMQKRGLISGYNHATAMTAILTALQKRPVIVGTVWLHNMFDPDSNGILNVAGATDGGHEYVLDEVDMKRMLVGVQNSWSDGWGINGRAYIAIADFEKFLLPDGDCTDFVPNTLPAPTPTPVPVDNTADAQFADALRKWIGRGPFFYKKVQAEALGWMDKKGL